MSRHLVISVRLHDDRFHGMDEPLPSPARLFQALVAACAAGGALSPEKADCLEWLETLSPPLLASPAMRAGQRVETYVPSNDLDAVRGDDRKISALRTEKRVEPKLLEAGAVFLFVWELSDESADDPRVGALHAAVEGLYQFGRGVDMAWATSEVVDTNALGERLRTYQGRVYRPSNAAGGEQLRCPEPGTLASLRAREAARHERFGSETLGRTTTTLLTALPPGRFRLVGYESPPTRRLYELRRASEDGRLGRWPLSRASALVVRVRSGARRRLLDALPERAADIERVLVGRKANGADGGPIRERVRIIPLPSIGHDHADRVIRRVLVEVPSGGPLHADDVAWSFSGMEICDPETGEVDDLVLVAASDEGMLKHYDQGSSARVWRTVTPVALPSRLARPGGDAPSGSGEALADSRARLAGAVVSALRHADVRANADSIRVQREPFDQRGERSETFADGGRFTSDRLWHVEVCFSSPVNGPLVLGDGRFLGLGLMAPYEDVVAVHAFEIESGLVGEPAPQGLERALRRAVMARVQHVIGRREQLAPYFSGHETDGAPATGESPHLTFLFDRPRQRLLVVAPHVVDRREMKHHEREHLRTLASALEGLRELRAGAAGLLLLRSITVDVERDELFAPARVWRSATSYLVTRHAKGVGASEALRQDVCDECRRRGLPEPQITPLLMRGERDVGLTGEVELAFATAVPGPVSIGRSRHLGGGLFRRVAESEGGSDDPHR